MRHQAGLFAAALFIVLPTTSHGLPRCAGPTEISNAHLLRVEKNGAIILTDGRAAHLEGIRLPEGAQDHAPQAFADQALSAIAALAQSGPLTLTAVAPKEDRYDRIRVQAFAGERWIQGELLARGLARVSIAPDRIECASELFAVEAKARVAHLGLWSSSAYAIRNPFNLSLDTGTFQVVEGKVLNAKREGWTRLPEFRHRLADGFHSDGRPCRQEELPRTRASIRRPMPARQFACADLVQSSNGPEIEVPNPQGIEVIQ